MGTTPEIRHRVLIKYTEEESCLVYVDGKLIDGGRDGGEWDTDWLSIECVDFNQLLRSLGVEVEFEDER